MFYNFWCAYPNRENGHTHTHIDKWLAITATLHSLMRVCPKPGSHRRPTLASGGRAKKVRSQILEIIDKSIAKGSNQIIWPTTSEKTRRWKKQKHKNTHVKHA